MSVYPRLSLRSLVISILKDLVGDEFFVEIQTDTMMCGLPFLVRIFVEFRRLNVVIYVGEGGQERGFYWIWQMI